MLLGQRPLLAVNGWLMCRLPPPTTPDGVNRPTAPMAPDDANVDPTPLPLPLPCRAAKNPTLYYRATLPAAPLIQLCRAYTPGAAATIQAVTHLGNTTYTFPLKVRRP